MTAYDLEIKFLDAAAKPIERPDNVGVDLLAYSRTPQSWEEIQPGAIARFPIGVTAPDDTASAVAVVTDVVYADRTSEGAQSKSVFVGRAHDAKEARQAITLLTPYPITAEALRLVLGKLRVMPHAIGPGVVANGVHLSGETAGVLFDPGQAVPDIGVPSTQQWDEIIAERSKRAAFFEAESQEAHQ